MISFVRSNLRIYRSSVTNYFLFRRYFNYGIIFMKCVKKAKLLKDSSKNGTIFDTKASIKLMTSSKQGKRLLFLIRLFWSKAILVLNVSAKFE